MATADNNYERYPGCRQKPQYYGEEFSTTVVVTPAISTRSLQQQIKTVEMELEKV